MSELKYVIVMFMCVSSACKSVGGGRGGGGGASRADKCLKFNLRAGSSGDATLVHMAPR